MKNFRRIAALLLAILLLTPPARAAADVGADFSDVPEWHWAYGSVRWASHYGLVKGAGKNIFGVGREVTRAEYATMLCRLMGWELRSPERGSFADNQDRSTWYYSAIETAYAHGALLKLGASCGPKEPLSREEMAAMTLRALGYGDGMLAGLAQGDCPFTDVSANQGYIALAYRMGFIGGINARTFSPKAACTREQAAAVLLRVYDRLHAWIAQYRGSAPAEAVRAGTLSETAADASGALIPLYPRAPLENVYDAAVKAGAGGSVALCAAPCALRVENGAITAEAELQAEELAAYLADESARTYRSARYRSSYLIRPEADGSTTYVWYETEEDLAEKVELCRLLGVSAVYFE